MLCDVELRVADCCFRAHRLVLAAASDYMRARFSIGMADSADESIDLPDMPAAAFEAVLEHMYTGLGPGSSSILIDSHRLFIIFDRFLLGFHRSGQENAASTRRCWCPCSRRPCGCSTYGS